METSTASTRGDARNRRLGVAALLVAALGLGAAACNKHALSAERKAEAMDAILPKTVGGALAGKRIYFGHQSVGYNIVDGLQAWNRERPELGLKIVESRTPDAFEGPVFAHATNGANYEPMKKIKEFADTVEGGVGAKADIAFFKFCYVDFSPETDGQKVFDEYKTTLARLRDKFPKTRFVHFTVPLTVTQTGPKAMIKRLIGRKIGGVEANIARERYNELLRREYLGKEPFFDLAKVEATRLDQRPASFEQDGRTYPYLAEEYASDGKHLNADGARWVAAHLIKTLAAL
jgi:hypothetical protein